MVLKSELFIILRRTLSPSDGVVVRLVGMGVVFTESLMFVDTSVLGAGLVVKGTVASTSPVVVVKLVVGTVASTSPVEVEKPVIGTVASTSPVVVEKLVVGTVASTSPVEVEKLVVGVSVVVVMSH